MLLASDVMAKWELPLRINMFSSFSLSLVRMLIKKRWAGLQLGLSGGISRIWAFA